MKNPLKVFIMLLAVAPIALGITGCSSGGVNGEGKKGSYDSGTPIVRGNIYNDIGWSCIEKGQYESAIKHFNDVLADSPTESERAEANNGIGWAKAKNREEKGKLEDGIKWFLLASDLSDDAKVGLASAYLQKGSLNDLKEVIEILYVGLGKNQPRFNYVPKRATGVTNAEVHAVLAYAFAATNDKVKSEEQLDYAKELEPNFANKSISQILNAIEFLNN